MEFNQEGLNKLIKKIGIAPEVNHLLEMGLTKGQLVEVIDSIFNPSSEKRNWGVARIFGVNIDPLFLYYKHYESRYKEMGDLRAAEYYRRESDKFNPSPQEGSKERYKTFAKYFGLGFQREFPTFKSLAKEEGVSGTTIKNRSERILRKCLNAKTRKGKIKEQIYQRGLEVVLGH